VLCAFEIFRRGEAELSRQAAQATQVAMAACRELEERSKVRIAIGSPCLGVCTHCDPIAICVYNERARVADGLTRVCVANARS
jgi:hypothetical protein